MRRPCIHGRYIHPPPSERYAAGFLLRCTFSLILLQCVYLSVLQNSHQIYLNHMNRPFQTDRAFPAEPSQMPPVFQPNASKPSGAAPLLSPLMEPVALADRLIYPHEKVLSEAKTEQLSIASADGFLKQIDRRSERFLISVPPPAAQHNKESVFHSLILKASHRHAIDPALIKAIIMAESGFNPKAISKMGAKGLMQLMPRTARALGVENVFDPEQNINGGVRYFKNLLNSFNGDVRLALAAYNAGSRKVKKYKGVPPYNVTRYYIKKVIRYRDKYRRQMAEDVKQFS